MGRVIVRILHADPGPSAGPLVRFLADARRANGELHVQGFRESGADDVALVSGQPDDTPFGSRLETLVRGIDGRRKGDGIIVLGAGSIPLASAVDRRAFLEAAGGSRR